MKKKIMIVALLGVILTSGILTVYAASQKFTTSLSIDSNSTLSGEKREHKYDKQKITFKWTEIGKISNVDPYLNVTLMKKGLIFYDDIAFNKLVVKPNTVESALHYGSTGSGKYYFKFNTQNGGTPTGYFKANPVYIESFE